MRVRGGGTWWGGDTYLHARYSSTVTSPTGNASPQKAAPGSCCAVGGILEKLWLGMTQAGGGRHLKGHQGPAASAGHSLCLTALTFTADRAEDALGGRRRLLEALRRNPNLLKKFRPILEEALEEKLESMGVKRVSLSFHCRHFQCQP